MTGPSRPPTGAQDEPAPRQPSALLGGRYLPLWQLPADTWCDIHLAHDPYLDRLVEIRVLLAHLTDHTDRRARFTAAVRATASVSHPGLIAVYDQGQLGGRPYAVCERATGPTLAEALASGEQLSPGRASAIGAVLAEGLAAAHRGRLVHGAISPQAIILTGDGGAKLTHLGLGEGAGQQGDLADLAATLLLSLDWSQALGGPLPLVLQEVAAGLPSDSGQPWSARALGRRLHQLQAELSGTMNHHRGDSDPVTAVTAVSPAWDARMEPTTEVPRVPPAGGPPSPRRQPARRLAPVLAVVAATAIAAGGTSAFVVLHPRSVTDRPSPTSTRTTATITGVLPTTTLAGPTATSSPSAPSSLPAPSLGPSPQGSGGPSGPGSQAPPQGGPGSAGAPGPGRHHGPAAGPGQNGG